MVRKNNTILEKNDLFLIRPNLEDRPHSISAYRRQDDDQELLSLELFHRAHFDVRQAHLTQQNSNLLTLERN